MKTHASASRQESATSEVRLHHRQSFIVALPRHTRLVVAEGAVQLSFADPSLGWLGTAAPSHRITLREGDSYLVEQACHATVSGAQAGMAELHLEASTAPGLLARLRTWFAGGETAPRAGAMSHKGH